MSNRFGRGPAGWDNRELRPGTDSALSETPAVTLTQCGNYRMGEQMCIGFYYFLEDCRQGLARPPVGDDLYLYVDPSTWATAVLNKTSKHRSVKKSRKGHDAKK